MVNISDLDNIFDEDEEELGVRHPNSFLGKDEEVPTNHNSQSHHKLVKYITECGNKNAVYIFVIAKLYRPNPLI